MAAVRYLFGSQVAYDAMVNKDPYAFYKTETNLYLGSIKLSNAAEIETVLSLIGDLSSLSTSAKTSLVAAINEIAAKSPDLATDATPGITKLFTEVGTATDGTMTQKAITDELGKKAEVSEVKDETLFINHKEDNE